jgi:hypothetical protein
MVEGVSVLDEIGWAGIPALPVGFAQQDDNHTRLVKSMKAIRNETGPLKRYAGIGSTYI